MKEVKLTVTVVTVYLYLAMKEVKLTLTVTTVYSKLVMSKVLMKGVKLAVKDIETSVLGMEKGEESRSVRFIM